MRFATCYKHQEVGNAQFKKSDSAEKLERTDGPSVSEETVRSALQ